MITINSLLKRRVALGMQTEIPDMGDYALEWFALAADFEAVKMPENATYCRDRGEHYSEYAEGNYSRAVDGCLAEIVAVSQ